MNLIKSQIENMRTVITNIEMQNNIMNASFQGEQLKDLGIQMFNTGLNTFNLGKSLSVSLFDNYIIQLKNISEQISFIINTYNTSNQQMQMMMMEQQNQFMQAQIMNQNINNIQENIEIKKMSIVFVIRNGHDPVITITYNFGTKIKDALEIYLNKIGKNKNQLNFYYNGRINYDDERKVEEVFGGGVPRIYVFEK